jgi:hypothetical protein
LPDDRELLSNDRRTLGIALPLFLSAPVASARSDDSQITLRVVEGRPLDVVLEQRVTIKSLGQPITATARAFTPS